MEVEVEEVKVVFFVDLFDQFVWNVNLLVDVDVSDVNCGVEGKENWFVQVGICIYLGCVLIGDVGEYYGWFCLCYGFYYDIVGCICKGLVFENLFILLFEFVIDMIIKIG